jgi:hypothetical protein
MIKNFQNSLRKTTHSKPLSGLRQKVKEQHETEVSVFFFSIKWAILVTVFGILAHCSMSEQQQP